jgi:hypothetical protein
LECISKLFQQNSLSENQQYLIEVTSLCVLRNKIDQQEARFGVGHLEVDELMKQLEQHSLCVKDVIAEIR